MTTVLYVYTFIVFKVSFLIITIIIRLNPPEVFCTSSPLRLKLCFTAEPPAESFVWGKIPHPLDLLCTHLKTVKHSW